MVLKPEPRGTLDEELEGSWCSLSETLKPPSLWRWILFWFRVRRKTRFVASRITGVLLHWDQKFPGRIHHVRACTLNVLYWQGFENEWVRFMRYDSSWAPHPACHPISGRVFTPALPEFTAEGEPLGPCGSDGDEEVDW